MPWNYFTMSDPNYGPLVSQLLSMPNNTVPTNPNPPTPTPTPGPNPVLLKNLEVTVNAMQGHVAVLQAQIASAQATIKLLGGA
jgi:hypothetical protein